MKLKLYKSTFEGTEQEWDSGVKAAAESRPLKVPKSLPTMVGMTAETAKNLKWKSLKWIISKDHDRKILKSVLKHPFKYGWRWLKSALKGKPFKRQGDFFLYG